MPGRIRAYFLIRWMFGGSVGIAHRCLRYAVKCTKHLFHAPETAAGQIDFFHKNNSPLFLIITRVFISMHNPLLFFYNNDYYEIHFTRADHSFE